MIEGRLANKARLFDVMFRESGFEVIRIGTVRAVHAARLAAASEIVAAANARVTHRRPYS